MDPQIQSRNLEIYDQIKEHVTKTLRLIGRHLPDIGRADVEIATEATRALKDHVVAQVHAERQRHAASRPATRREHQNRS